MEYKRFDNTIIARIDKGEEVLEKIKEISLKENIKLWRIDYILHSKDFEGTICYSPDLPYSDHNPVVWKGRFRL